MGNHISRYSGRIHDATAKQSPVLEEVFLWVTILRDILGGYMTQQQKKVQFKGQLKCTEWPKIRLAEGILSY